MGKGLTKGDLFIGAEHLPDRKRPSLVIGSCLCLICKNHKPDPDKKKYICKAFGDYPFEDGPLICGQFEWRGVQKEDGNV